MIGINVRLRPIDLVSGMVVRRRTERTGTGDRSLRVWMPCCDTQAVTVDGQTGPDVVVFCHRSQHVWRLSLAPYGELGVDPAPTSGMYAVLTLVDKQVASTTTAVREYPYADDEL